MYQCIQGCCLLSVSSSLFNNSSCQMVFVLLLQLSVGLMTLFPHLPFQPWGCREQPSFLPSLLLLYLNSPCTPPFLYFSVKFLASQALKLAAETSRNSDNTIEKFVSYFCKAYFVGEKFLYVGICQIVFKNNLTKPHQREKLRDWGFICYKYFNDFS